AAGGFVERFADGAPGRLGELVHPPQQPDADTLRAELRCFASDGLLEEAEQAIDLVVGAGPVLAAERVQRQDRDATAHDVAEQAPDRLDAGGVTLELRQ